MKESFSELTERLNLWFLTATSLQVSACRFKRSRVIYGPIYMHKKLARARDCDRDRERNG